jgi:microcystin-dependent protein
MSEPFLAEVRIVSFNFAPRGWAFCDGQLLPINQNQALFSLLGTIYGGDGRTTFALPDLRGRVPIHSGNSHSPGQRGGQQDHTLALDELPQHTHQVNASAQDANTSDPAGNVLAVVPGRIYHDPSNLNPLSASSVGDTGGGQAHENMQPYLALNFIIALQGLFPSRN